MRFRHLFLALLAFAVVSSLARVVLHAAGLADFYQDDVKTSVAAEQPSLNLVFIGTSHFDGIDPDVFDAELAKQGHAIRSFDLNLGGLGVVEMRQVVERLFELRPCCIKYVLFEAAFMQTDIGQYSDNLRSIMFFDGRNMVDFMRMIYAYPTLPNATTELEYLANTTLAMLAHYTNVGLATVLLGWGKTELTNFRQLSWGRGNNRAPPMVDRPPPENENLSLDFEVVLSDDLNRRPQFIASLHARPDQVISDQMLDYILDIGDYIRKKGAVPIIVQPPLVGWWDYAAAFTEKFRHRCGDARLLDFSDPIKFPDFYGNLQYWSDGSHISGVGAVAWSELLAARFADLLKRGIAADTLPFCKS
jgi:hypothetical protein